MQNEKSFSYHVNIEIGAHKLSMIIRNANEIPDSLIKEMAEQRIKSEIQKLYTIDKHYRTQTNESFYDKMSKLSNYEVNDLSVCEIYDLNMKFKNNEIINHYEKTDNVEIRQSKINRNENEFNFTMVR